MWTGGGGQRSPRTLPRHADLIPKAGRSPEGVKFRNEMIRCTFQLDHSGSLWAGGEGDGRRGMKHCFVFT